MSTNVVANHRRYRHRTTVLSILVVTLAMLNGCGQNHINNLSLGDVSIGQELIDLQRALAAGAITDAEYAQAKAALLKAVDLIPEAIEGATATEAAL